MLYKRRPNIEMRVSASLAYLFDPASRMCHVLNDLAVILWQYLDEARTLEDIIGFIASNPSSAFVSGVEKLLRELESFGLIELLEEQNVQTQDTSLSSIDTSKTYIAVVNQS